MTHKNHGGARPGAGRPKSNLPLRKPRSFKATDIEWTLIQERAARAGYKNVSDYIRARTLAD